MFSRIDRPRAALPRHGEVALEAARVEVVVEPRDDEGGVDVGGDDLLDGLVAGGLAREDALARQHGVDRGAVATASPRRTATQSPTAGRSRRDRASWRSRPLDVGQRLVVFEVHAERGAVGNRHARRHEPGAACGANASASRAVQPREDRDIRPARLQGWKAYRRWPAEGPRADAACRP